MNDAECKWLITATPVQNSDSDMISLAELVGLTTHQASVVRDLIMYRVSNESMVVDEGTISIVNIDLDAQHMDIYKHVSALWNSDDLVKATSSIMVQVSPGSEMSGDGSRQTNSACTISYRRV